MVKSNLQEMGLISTGAKRTIIVLLFGCIATTSVDAFYCFPQAVQGIESAIKVYKIASKTGKITPKPVRFPKPSSSKPTINDPFLTPKSGESKAIPMDPIQSHRSTPTEEIRGESQIALENQLPNTILIHSFDYYNNIFIEITDDGQYITKKFGNKEVTNSFNQTLETNFSKLQKIIIDGVVTNEFAEYLASKGVHYFTDYEAYQNPRFKSSRKIKIIYVASTDESELVDFFGVSQDQAKKLSDLFSTASSQPFCKIANSKIQLEEELKISKTKKENAIVIFNNNNQGKIFNEPISAYNIENVITCNSYSIEDNPSFLKTTDFINIPDVVEAITKSVPKDAIKLDNFFQSFSYNYNDALKRRKANLVLTTIGVLSIPGGAISVIVYYNLIKKE